MEQLDIFNLAMYYRSEFLKYDRRIFTITTVKNSKWWKYFEETIEKFSGREGWNPSIFIKCQFESFGKIYPPQLVTERAWNTFQEYKFRFEGQPDKNEQIIKDVITGYQLVKSFCSDRKSPFSIFLFLSDKFQRRQLEIEAYPIYLFVFSKAYISIFGTNNTKRMIVAQNQKLLTLVKKILGNDYV